MFKSKLYSIMRYIAYFTRVPLYNFFYYQFNKDSLSMRTGSIFSKKQYEQEYVKFLEANTVDMTNFVKLLEDTFKVKIPVTEINKMAFITQFGFKKGSCDYSQGFLLFSVLTHYIKKQKGAITIFETGTAKGFSSLCMALALDKSKAQGKILTVDILPVHQKIIWGGPRDEEGKMNRYELLQKWSSLIDKYILYVQSYTDLAVKQLFLPRIHVAFLDAQHDYKSVSSEARYVKKFQKKGDIIICDDYDKLKFKGIVRAVDEFAKKHNYAKDIYGLDGSHRKFAILTKR